MSGLLGPLLPQGRIVPARLAVAILLGLAMLAALVAGVWGALSLVTP